jgi:hypothetical protein
MLSASQISPYRRRDLNARRDGSIELSDSTRTMRKASSAILNSIIEADVYRVIDRPLTAAAERGTTRQGIASQLFRASLAAFAAKGCEKPRRHRCARRRRIGVESEGGRNSAA